jgi:DNA-binding NarL/FixJ family response regulator
MNPSHILLVDDHAMFRAGLRMVLADGLPQSQVHEASSVDEAMQDAGPRPDVVLLDIKLPGLNGLDGIALLQRKWPQVPVMMLSSMDEPDMVRRAMAHGAVGFVSKAQTGDAIISAVGRLLRGEPVEPGDATTLEEAVPRLTPRQCEVLDLLSRGLSNKLVARKLNLSENTVRGHVQAILAFLQVSSRSEAAFEARRRGLVS